MCGVCFFFSSRRRHTRCSRDWSSDVCSSDLRKPARDADQACSHRDLSTRTRPRWRRQLGDQRGQRRNSPTLLKIGRASCRESVDLGGRRIIKKKKKKELGTLETEMSQQSERD